MYIYVDIHLRKEVNINYKLFHLFTHNTQSKPQTHALTVTKVLLLFVRYLVFFKYIYYKCNYLKQQKKVDYEPNHIQYARLKFIIKVINC